MRPYPIFLLLAVAAGATCAGVRLCRRGIGGARTVVLLAASLLAALLGAKLFSVVERGGIVWSNATWELTYGYRYPGGLIGIAAAAIWLRGLLPPTVSLLRVADALVPAMALSMSIVRAGCFLAGCCHGLATESFWAVRFPAETPAWHAHVDRGWIAATQPFSAAVHPLQLYFGTTSLALAGFLMRRRPGRDGEVFFLFLLIDGALKLGLEQIRLDYRPSLVWSAALFAATGMFGLGWSRRRSN